MKALFRNKIFFMKKTIFYLILLCLTLPSSFAQKPDWKVDENAYQYTMTFVAKLNVDGKQLIGTNDKVGAFVGTTCRGTTGLIYVPNENSYYAYLTVFSNTQDEAIYFKLYDSTIDKTTFVSKPIVFKILEHRGNLFQSFSIAEPALNDKTDLLTFNFLDIKSVNSEIKNGKVNISIYESYNLTNLKPIFTLSKGGKLLKNRSVQKSGEITDDFSSAIIYEVLSEDESNLSSYTVAVSKLLEPNLFYKKDAVCNIRGSIKVVSKREGALVSISSNSKTKASKLITNGEALFLDLDADSYITTIENEWKIINIELKEN